MKLLCVWADPRDHALLPVGALGDSWRPQQVDEDLNPGQQTAFRRLKMTCLSITTYLL